MGKPGKLKRDRDDSARSVSMRQIAEEANVSINTVSRVLRGLDRIAPDTRTRVLEIARRLHYRPNLLVRAMQTGRTGTIGVMIPVHLPYYAEIVHGIHDVLIAADHVPITLWSATNEQGSGTNFPELQQIHRLVDRRVDAVILRPVDEAVSDAYLQEIWDCGLPLVTVDRELSHTHADHVGTSNHVGGKIAAQYLLDLGHRHLGVLTPQEPVHNYQARTRGFEEVVCQRPEATCYTVEIPSEIDASERVGVASQLLAVDPRPTGVFAPSDSFAVNLYEAARQVGLRIPQDISVVGYGDLPLGYWVVPNLTTLCQHPYAVGAEAARIALARISGELTGPTPQRVYLPPEVVERHSAGPPPAGN